MSIATEAAYADVGLRTAEVKYSARELLHAVRMSKDPIDLGTHKQRIQSAIQDLQEAMAVCERRKAGFNTPWAAEVQGEVAPEALAAE
jgi:hypothetical protein